MHHALCNVIEPIFENSFIYDSYANRKGKGVLKAIERFEYFKRKVSRNLATLKTGNGIKGFVLKADIRKFFDSVSHEILMKIIRRKIRDEKVLWLIKIILQNHCPQQQGKGMPLGNLTSQFFANVYLNELDYFIKQNLKVKYYIRYVDDFVLLHKSKEMLEHYKKGISIFLETSLSISLHPDKSAVFPLYRGLIFSD